MYPILLAALAPILWGSTYAAVGLFLTDLAPIWVAVWRALGAGLFLWLFVRRMPRMHLAKVFVLGFFNIGLFFILLMMAAYRLPGSIAGTLGATLPLLLIVMQWLAQGKTPQLKATLSALVGLCGVVLLLNPSADLDPIGVACALGATFVVAIATLLTKHWQVNDILGVATWQLLMSGVLLVPVAWFFEGAPSMIQMPQIPGLVWLVILNTAFGYLIAVNAIKQIGPNAFGMLSLLNPIVAVVLGMWMLQENLGALQWLGIALIIGSLLAANMRSKRRFKIAQISPQHDKAA
ncbi:putative DMT superfamily transporter inner membrane protein [Marinomonas aquimarina]|uniref:Putative DMT superfamily transporter inner membrane protein n=1 Tax=Marinomonas aquimarina TaxID=295068 RepID=A0A1A8THX2_9GAMM|nr:EamA family transporter [Marinomonas aquimarina]SBS33206.1 putative DMT superfamily transporter inner membrane protein [Marinomonas aquimarina]